MQADLDRLRALTTAADGTRNVVIESPFGGARGEDVEANLEYVRRCMADCLDRGEAPFASHALYTQPGVRDDTVPAQREQGMAAGFSWRAGASLTAVYVDRGITSGMILGILHSQATGTPVEFRSLAAGGRP